MAITIAARNLLGPQGLLEHPIVDVEDGVITRIRGREAAETRTVAYSFPEALLVPSYLDIHVHGAAGRDLMDATPDAIGAVETYLAAHGVGAFFPTTITASIDATLRALDFLAGEIERGPADGGAAPLGIHLEGPFLSVAKRGVHPANLLLEPTVSNFERFWQAARGHIRLLTIAPEIPHALELIQYAGALGVRCSLGHSNATVAEAEAGFRAGARSATHTFNAMRALNHRDPGIAAYVLDNDGLFADIICDGFHVDPALVRLFFKAKGPDRAILITDALAAAGMPDGKYKAGGLEVEVHDGHCTSGGVIAGSILSMDEAVRNFASFTSSGLVTAARLAARNPARLMGVEDRWGTLEEGREANLTVLSSGGDVLETFRAGRPVHHPISE